MHLIGSFIGQVVSTVITLWNTSVRPKGFLSIQRHSDYSFRNPLLNVLTMSLLNLKICQFWGQSICPLEIILCFLLKINLCCPVKNNVCFLEIWRSIHSFLQGSSDVLLCRTMFVFRNLEINFYNILGLFESHIASSMNAIWRMQYFLSYCVLQPEFNDLLWPSGECTLNECNIFILIFEH